MSEDGELPSDGRLIGARYRLVERIGAGPSGTVWRAHDEQDERYVAVKEPRLTGDPRDEERRRAVQRLPHEARAAAWVDHPSAVTIHDVLLEDELPWIVMELVEGESLEAALAARGPLPDTEVARIGLAVLGALHTAHGVGIVHRDLKPANVLLEAASGRVVVTDFGIGAAAHAGGRETAAGGREASAGGRAGGREASAGGREASAGGRESSAGFVAPECASGPGAGPASDLWSLGAVLRAAVAEARPGPLGALLDRLLATEPEQRPLAEEVAQLLAEVAGAPVPEWAVKTSTPDSGERAAVPHAGAHLVAAATADPALQGAGATVTSAGARASAPDPASTTGSGPDATTAPAASPGADGHDPSAPPSAAPAPAPDLQPRRLTALSAFGLLLQKKPERG
ncbi:serine/threonine-protein kinase [Streptomyces griseorubiginosus]|uniref:non-specific serine/threonine protein kinase n=1 Tax=Streptomyces griseorubiginosus TaxID=67304 RepID=A0AAI8PMA2_9ACTN|nr:serine/threonine-protein kinase [Streptomyces griseorubiginosus]AYC39123.1 Serine/threonine-protein kinase PrkC [Streptomyces griseorubiginosus]